MKSILLRLGALFLLATGTSFVANTLITDNTHAVPFTNTNVSQQVYQQLSQFAADPDQAPEDGEEEPETSCVVTGIGWIVCPIVRFMAEIVDASYGYVRSLLVVQPLLTTGNSQPTYQAWEIMRNFANVAFVIAFLIIIFSQVTSVGLTNYGIKKLLPRIIIAAILVNVSFWVCAIAVDLSNIVGSSVNGVFDSIRENLAQQPAPGEENAFNNGEGWLGIAGAVLAGGLVAGGIAYATISAFIPAVLVAVIAIVTVFLVLVIRQALIILLVIVSPLAFVAFLLPNTENMFNRWRSLFQTLLLMFPIIAALFGASALASYIIMRSADGPYETIIQVAGALVAIAPLAITPLVMKTAGNLLGRFGAVMNQRSSGIKNAGAAYRDRRKAITGARRLRGQNMFGEAGKRFQKKGSRVAEKGGRWNKLRGGAMNIAGGTLVGGSNSKMGQYVNQVSTFGEVRKLEKEQQSANAQKALSDAKAQYVAENASGSDAKSIANAEKYAGPTGDPNRIQANAVTMQRSINAEEVKNAQTMARATIEPGNLDEIGDRMVQALKSDDAIQAQAMQNMLLTSGGAGVAVYRSAMNKAGWETSEDGKSSVRTMDNNGGLALENKAAEEMRRNYLENHSGTKASGADLMAQAKNGSTMQEATASPDTWKGMSDEEFSKQKGKSLQAAYDMGGLNTPAAVERATRAINNQDLKDVMDAEAKAVIEKVAAGIKQGQASAGAQAGQAAQQLGQQAGQLNVPHNNPQPTQPTYQQAGQPNVPRPSAPQQRPSNPNFNGPNNPS